MSDDTFDPSAKPITPFGNDKRVDSGFDPTAGPSSGTSPGSQPKYITVWDNTKPGGYRAVPLSLADYLRWRAGEIAISNSRTGDYTLGSESGSALHPPYLPADLDIVSFIPNYHRSMVRDKADLHTRMELPNPAEQYSAQCTEPQAGNTQFCSSCAPFPQATSAHGSDPWTDGQRSFAGLVDKALTGEEGSKPGGSPTSAPRSRSCNR